MTSSVTNHVTGIENGSESGWLTHTVSEGNGDGYSSSSSWSGSWNSSYDQTVTYPGFYDYRYYGQDYGGGSGEENYIAYVSDAFYDNPGSDTGLFPFAYSGEEVLLSLTESGASQSDASPPTLVHRARSTHEVSGRSNLAAAEP